jgi:hypothetical protein
MIKCQENGGDIIRNVEVDLTEVTNMSRQDLESSVTKYLEHEGEEIFNFEAGNKLVYETEVLIPKVTKNRINLLMVLGNPAVHSVTEGMFFSYEKRRCKENKETWVEHRFWRSLRDCGVLTFGRNGEKLTPENIEEMNDYKRDCLLNGEYESDFNIFFLPYFSFPTPASRKECNGVAGIRKIVGKEIFKEMKEFEFQRFRDIVLHNDIKNVICFQKTDVLKELKNRTKHEQVLNNSDYPVHKVDIASKQVILYYAGPTKSILTNKGKNILKSIVAEIKDKNRIG